MPSVSALGGVTNAFNAVSGAKQPGPPDHAKAWGWRAKQAAAAEEIQTPTGTPPTDSEAPDAVTEVGETTEAPTVQQAVTPPSEADMESVILGLISNFGDDTGTNVTPLYDDVKALFT